MNKYLNEVVSFWREEKCIEAIELVNINKHDAINFIKLARNTNAFFRNEILNGHVPDYENKISTDTLFNMIGILCALLEIELGKIGIVVREYDTSYS